MNFRVTTGDRVLLESSTNGWWIFANPGDGQSESGNAASEMTSGSDWRHFAVTYGGDNQVSGTSHVRHFLVVDPDIVIIADDIPGGSTNKLASNWLTDFNGKWDDAWKRYDLKSGQMRMLVQSIGSVPIDCSAPEAIESHGDLPEEGRWRLRWHTGSPATRFLTITVLLVSSADHPRSYACKWLESAGAFGVRIHRDGYPTLVAFRKSGVAHATGLAGFAFDAPVAVSVYTPKRRSGKSP